MARITDIAPQQKDKTRCNLYFDGRFACGLSLETVMTYRLKAGQEIDGTKLQEIAEESEKKSALEKALFFLSSSPKTEKQLKDHLLKKGFTPAAVDYAAEKVKSYGYISDGAYASEFVKSYAPRAGRRVIEQKLKQKGVPQEEIDNALSALEGEEETAKKIAEKYLRNKEKTKENYYKAVRHLISKGFSAEDAKGALAAVWGGEDETLLF